MRDIISYSQLIQHTLESGLFLPVDYRIKTRDNKKMLQRSKSLFGHPVCSHIWRPLMSLLLFLYLEHLFDFLSGQVDVELVQELQDLTDA